MKLEEERLPERMGSFGVVNESEREIGMSFEGEGKSENLFAEVSREVKEVEE